MTRARRGTIALVEEPQRTHLPLWREALTGVEYLQLKTRRVYYGFGVPRGNGAPVITVPGFLACDLYLLEMNLWLRRLGYKPWRSRIGYNAECPEVLTQRLAKTVGRAYQKTGRKVHLVGHSLGGVLARAVAFLQPEQVASVITLASPFRGVRINPLIARPLEHVRRRVIRHPVCTYDDCFSYSCNCTFLIVMGGRWPPHIQQTAVYTKHDGVVQWGTCINNDPDTDVEVNGSHVGLAWNADAYVVIAERLAQAERALAEPEESPLLQKYSKKTTRPKAPRTAASAGGAGRRKASRTRKSPQDKPGTRSRSPRKRGSRPRSTSRG